MTAQDSTQDDGVESVLLVGQPTAGQVQAAVPVITGRPD
jgi:hypothetical protein